MKKKFFLLIPLASMVVSCGSIPPTSTTTSESSTDSLSYSSSEHSSIDIDDPTTYWDSSQDHLREGTKKLDFYNLNDFHGAVDYNEAAGEAGMVKISSYINQKRLQNPNGFVFTTSGDMWQGSASSNLTKGALVVDWLNYLGCSAQALGNHEFDWGRSVIEENVEKMNFPMLACNIWNSTLNDIVDDWLKPFTTRTINGVHVGIIGAIGQGLTNSISAKLVKDLDFLNPTNYVNKWADHLRSNGADVIVYLIHDTVEDISSSTLDKVDAVFGGHTHQYQNKGTNVPMIQSSSNGKALGHIELTYSFEDSDVVTANGENLNIGSSYLKNIEDDSTAKAIYDYYYYGMIAEENNKIVGNYKGGIDKNDLPYVYNSYAYKYFKDEVDTDNEYEIFGVESNNARADISADKDGNITYGSVYKAFPFDNTLVLVKISGQNIIKVLCTYSSARFSLTGIGYVDRKNMSNYVDVNKDYYMLMINYISDGEYTAPYVDVIAEYSEDAALPRNIVATYLKGYPNNLSF